LKQARGTPERSPQGFGGRDTLANKIGQAAFARAIGEYGSVIFG
jgi:hypothetical protein